MNFVFDFGNARVKWFVPKTGEYGDFLHAIATQLTENDWQRLGGRHGKPPEGVVKVNGIPYVIGDAARRHTISERPAGAARYVPHYYGPALAYAMSEAFKRSDMNVKLYASHPPLDIAYVPHLVGCARNYWEVESRHGQFQYKVTDVRTFDEPLGGFSHFVLNTDGTEKKRNPLAKITTLVVDVGGFTVDVAAVDPGGAIDLLSLDSTRAGVLNLISQFERELRTNNRTLFQDTRNIDIRRLEEAIMVGEYRFGKERIRCEAEAIAAKNSLVYEVTQVISKAGGVANFEVILMTGGGAALIYEALRLALPRAEIIVAEPNIDLMKYANVFGGGKISKMLRKLGIR